MYGLGYNNVKHTWKNVRKKWETHINGTEKLENEWILNEFIGIEIQIQWQNHQCLGELEI